MNLMNPEGNPCYFTFEIVLNDTDETIYTSKMVEPKKEDWKKAADGEYADTVTFTISYVDKSE